VSSAIQSTTTNFGGSFTKKRIAVTFRISSGTVSSSRFNTVKFDGDLRASVHINYASGTTQPLLSMSLFGLAPSLGNQLSLLGASYRGSYLEQVANYVIVQAGDDVNGMSTVFSGTVRDALLEYSGQPDCSLFIQGQLGGLAAMRPAAPTSYKGPVTLISVLNAIAAKTNATIDAHGILNNIVLVDPYFPGTPLDQITACAKQAGISITTTGGDDGTQLVIHVSDGGSSAASTVNIGPSTGMIGYPTFSGGFIQLRTIFNPTLQVFQNINVTSSISPANGMYQIRTLQHHLEAETPGGQWASQIEAAPPNVFIPGQTAPTI
jgi:hypothetical protein